VTVEFLLRVEAVVLPGRGIPLGHGVRWFPEKVCPHQGLRRPAVCDKDDPAPPGAVLLSPPAGQQPGNFTAIGSNPDMNTGRKWPVNGRARSLVPAGRPVSEGAVVGQLVAHSTKGDRRLRQGRAGDGPRSSRRRCDLGPLTHRWGRRRDAGRPSREVVSVHQRPEQFGAVQSKAKRLVGDRYVQPEESGGSAARIGDN